MGDYWCFRKNDWLDGDYYWKDEFENYGYSAKPGKIYFRKNAQIHGPTLDINDILTVHLDLINGKIFYSKNGIKIKNTEKSVKNKGIKYRIAVTMNRDSQITLLNY